MLILDFPVSYRFPLKDPSRLCLWLDALQRNNWTPGPYSFLCSEHFSPESFVHRMPDQNPLLTSNAVPSLFKRCNARGGEGQVQCTSRLKKSTQVQEIRMTSTQEESSLAFPKDSIFIESQTQTIIITEDDFKDTNFFAVSDVLADNSNACKFISSLHSYSSSAKSPFSQSGTKENCLPQLMNASNQENPVVETSEGFPSYTGSGVSTSDQLHIEFNNEMSSQSVPTSQYTIESNEDSVNSGMQTCVIQQEERSFIHKDISSLHSYCFSSKPMRGQRRKRSKNMPKSSTRYDQCQDQSMNVSHSTPPLNPIISPLAWMLGTWESDPAGSGEFPTIPPFCYQEEAIITHVGQPMLNFIFCASNPETGKPLHRECGFIRIKPGTNKVAFICAQNTGVVEVEEGEVEGEQLSLTSHSLCRTSFAKDPHVTQICRKFQLTPEGKLEQIVLMATGSQPLAPHLHVTYKKMEP
ncbi:hypothetical protein GDO86_010242 [Hymenochirus boettgeri]|uniref:THAP-type domain-containing protein n=1 Tax=Hymenochirus boettgeri TaxID=247094 RepID=A0A8T2JM50_9PIPI|nr:hypothetical protein GDO86_010242 [Hymenochirus boettgeri]